MTALLEAVKRGALDEIRKIVADHPNLVHQRDDLGTTALHNAAFWVSVSGPISGGKGVRISMRGIRVRSDPGGLGNRIYTRDGWVSRD